MNDDNGNLPVVEWEFDELRLRLFRDDARDAEAVTVASRDPETLRGIPLIPTPYTVDDAYAFIRGPAVECWKLGRAQWAIAEAADDRVVGSIGVPRRQPAFGSAEIGYLITPEARGRGIAPRAAAQVAEYLFAHGVVRAELHVSAGNLASQRAALRGGFTLDGRLRRGFPSREGDPVDRLVFARLTGDAGGPVVPAIPDLADGHLSDGVVTLRPLASGDADDYFALLNLPEVWQRNVPPVAVSRDTAEKMCRYVAAEQWLHGVAAHLAIRDADTDAFLGDVALHVSHGPPGEAMLSYSLNRSGRGRGLASRAVRLLGEWAFDTVGVRRLMAGTAPDNEASQAVLRRAGFTREGVQRALLPGLHDTRVDNVCWSLLPDER